jgi:hypothetical protein
LKIHKAQSGPDVSVEWPAEKVKSIIEGFEKIQDDERSLPGVVPAVFYFWPFAFGSFERGGAVILKRRAWLESEASQERIGVWVKEMLGVDVPSVRQNRQGRWNILDMKLFQVYQKVKEPRRGKWEADDLLWEVPKLSSRIGAFHMCVIDTRTCTLSMPAMEGYPTPKFVSRLFVFSRSVCGSRDGMFICVDYKFGLTMAFRVLYDKGQPASICPISELSYDGRGFSRVNGHHGLIATAFDKSVVLWEIFGGTIHRIFDCGCKVTAIDCDGSFVWIAAGSKGSVYDVNGDLVGNFSCEDNVTVICCVERRAVFGTMGGKLGLLEWDFALISKRMLPSLHASEIQQIVFDERFSRFMSIDSDGVKYMWYAVGREGKRLNPDCYADCCLCRRPGALLCKSCHRLVCGYCCGGDGRCLFCTGLDVF